MRNKFLYTIWSLMLFTIILSSCIKGENEEYEYSTDASVRAFSIDTINGKKYKFSIDLLNNRIFNADSLPYLSDTLLHHFAIDTFTVTGYVFTGDTVLKTPAYTDLTKAMNGKDGIMFTVFAADGRTSKNYRLDVRVHQQDPDSLTWGLLKDVPQGFAMAALGDNYKVLSNDEELLIFNGNEQCVYHAALGDGTGYTWNVDNLNGVPENVIWSSALRFGNKLYVNTDNGEVYGSADGVNWTKAEALSGNVKTLLVGMTKRLLAIQTIDGKDYFCQTEAEDVAWSTGVEVPEGFPTEQIESTLTITSTGVEKATITGMPLTHEDEVVPWFTFEGNEWAALDTETLACPAMGHPTIFSLDKTFFIFGNNFEDMYYSPSALTWGKVTKRVLLPEALKGKTNYSTTMDKDKFIWIVISENGNNQLWRGRLNRYGFKH